nr:fimbria/pilus outer membrane usher protein [Pseudomonas taiwanensis]
MIWTASQGVWRYSATVGRYDGAEQLDDPLFWQATLARGGAWDTTLYGGLLSSEYYNASVLGMARDVGHLGALSFDVTRSSSDLGNTLGETQGHSFALRYGKSFQTRTNLRFAGYRYSTQGYRDFDEAVQQRSNASRYLGNRRSRLEASVYQRVSERSALNLTFSQDTYWQTSLQRRQYQLQYTTRVGKVAINLFASQALDSKNDDSRLFGLSLSVPLDFGRQQQASFDLRNDNGRASERASLSGGLLDNQLTYSTSLTNDSQGRSSGGLSINYQGSQASVGMGYNEGNDYRSMSVNASGAVMLHGDGVAFGSHLGETMALVHVPDVPGVGVQNTPSARTNSHGYALVPYLRPYRLNALVLQTDDLSPEVVIANASQQVVPRRGAVVKASYEAEHVARLVLTLLQANGQPVPFGAQVLDADGQSLGVVGQAGQALVSTRTTGPQAIGVMWGEASDTDCTLNIDPQCSLKSNAVSADPVKLGDHTLADFTGVGTTTASVPFHITLSDCEDASAPNPAAANVYIELDGANGSVPTVPAEGRFSLGAASDAAGVEIQLLRSDGTPMPLQSDELVKPVSIGITQLDFQARYYQSAPVVTPGLAEGGLTFTVSYK